MGAHNSKDKLSRSYSERYIHSQVIERERFGSFGKRAKGAAKKRDVRNLSISPTDLGPPPKTQQTANGTSTRSPTNAASISNNNHNQNGSSSKTTLNQKRYTHGLAATASSLKCGLGAALGGGGVGVTGPSIKGHPPSPLGIGKKYTGVHHSSVSGSTSTASRRLEAKAAAAAAAAGTIKSDHNRLIGNGPQTNNSSAPAGTKNNAGAATAAAANSKQAELHDIVPYNNNNHIPTPASSAGSAPAEKASTRTNTTSPIIGHHPNRKVIGTGAAAIAVAANILEKRSTKKSIFHKSQARATEGGSTTAPPSPSPPPPPTASATPLILAGDDLRRLKNLSRFSTEGCLDFRALEEHLQLAELTNKHLEKGMQALGILVNYLAQDLDAFAYPETKHQLDVTVELLSESRTSYTELQDRLCDTEAFYVQREEELQSMYRCELDKVESSCRDQKTAYEEEFSAKEAEQQRALHACQVELEQLRQRHLQQLDEVQRQCTAGEQREQQLQQQLTDGQQREQQLQQQLTEGQQREQLLKQQLADGQRHEQQLQQRINTLELIEQQLHCSELQHNERVGALNERVRSLSKELESLRASKQHDRRDEIPALRTTNRSISEIAPMGGSPSSTFSEMSRLQNEAESLRCVLELKQKEISKLTKQNEELLRDADERLTLQAKISVLESRTEMLQSELHNKSEKEKDLQRQIEDDRKTFNHEHMKRTRLTYDNEELRWQLKQRSEQLHIVESKLQELSFEYDSLNASQTSSRHRLSLHNGSGSISGGGNSSSVAACKSPHIQVGDNSTSPPTSPFVKSIIEKNDSVSWVLQMDDETPEAAAFKLVQRAGSFRAERCCPTTRRQLSLSANATLMGGGINGSAGDGPNPLSLSMSATSMSRQHSSDPTSAESASSSHARLRSKSVGVKSNDLQVPAAAATASKKVGDRKMARQMSLAAGVGASTGKSTRKHELKSNCGGGGAATANNWLEPICASSPYNGAGLIRPRTSTLKEESTHEGSALAEAALFQRNAKAQKLITCDTSALNSGERLAMHSLPSHPSMQEIKSACDGGNIMVASTTSEDEVCSASSDEIGSSASACSASATTATSSSSISLGHQLQAKVALDKISNSLSGTPMEVSWSEEDANDVL